METQTWLDLQLPWKWWPFWNPSTGNLPVTVSLLEAMGVISFCCFFLRTRTTFFCMLIKVAKTSLYMNKDTSSPPQKRHSHCISRRSQKHKNNKDNISTRFYHRDICVVCLYSLSVYPFPPGDPYLISKISRITDWWFPTSIYPC